MENSISSGTLLTIAFAPLIASILSGIFGTKLGGNKFSRTINHSLTIFGVLLSFILSTTVLSQVIDGAKFNETIYEWMKIGNLKMEVGF